jgi:hypothetical protein
MARHRSAPIDPRPSNGQASIGTLMFGRTLSSGRGR